MANIDLHDCRAWAAGDPALEEYHDHEWCRIKHDDQFAFELLCLEGASVGLSWKTILHKREAYREAFFHFDIKQCSTMPDEHIAELLQNPGIIRHKGKIASVRKNARAVLSIQEAFGSFDQYLWGFTNGKQIVGQWESLSDVPTMSALSEAVSKDMKRRGMSFVGPVIIYSYLQSIGIINDHLVSCPCFADCKQQSA